jgi:hypothetical protein
METINKVDCFIFESKAWKLIVVVFGITLFKTGIWYIPNLDVSLAIAQNPFANPFSDQKTHYLFWSWLGPFVAWAIGLKSTFTFFMFHLAFSIAFSLLFISVVFFRFPDKLARISFILFSALPVSATAYYWVSSDSITLFLMLVAVAYPRYALITLLTGIALGMQHFEQGFVASAGLLSAILLSKKYDDHLNYSTRFCVLLILGVVAGKLFLIGLFSYYSIEVNSSRLHWLFENIHLPTSQFFFHFHHIIWSILGLGWLVALRYLDWGRKTIPFFLALFGLGLILPLTVDQTRVLAIITFPLLAVYWLLNVHFLDKLLKKEISLFFLIWAITPWSWVWSGTPKWSVFPYDVAYILYKLLGWFEVPANRALWPF